MRVGLIINPVAGIGGSVGLKGSDGLDTVVQARARGAVPRATQRVLEMLMALGQSAHQIKWVAPIGPMGGDLLGTLKLPVELVPGTSQTGSVQTTTAADTVRITESLYAAGIGLLVFAGGDGTARDLHAVLADRLPVLGVPAGVKMHSGVFATSPRTAAEVLLQLVSGKLVSGVRAEVRDVDEEAARDGIARSRWHGEMLIPMAGGFIQQTKIGGREDDALALEDIVQGVCALVGDDSGRPWIFGPGGSMLAIKERLGGQGTLLGVDVRLPDSTWCIDVSETDLLAILGSPRSLSDLSDRPTGAVDQSQVRQAPRLVISFGRNQGIVFGRGNQQLSPRVLARMDRHEDIVLLASRSKITGLEGRPLLLDTGDAALDRQLAGVWQVLCGFDDRLLYRVEPA